ncbi:MAG: ABC transporter permease [Acidobacteriota bacterium]|nr:ABC transporter permease [Acidobacteriota bacterium]
MSLMQDLRFGLRVLSRRPALTAAAVACLALGIASVTAVFSFVDGVLLRPLPYPDSDRVVVVWNQFLGKDVPKAPSSGWEFEDHRDHGQSFEAIAGFIPWDYNLTGSGEPVRVEGCRVSAALFPILGAQTQLGRTYTLEEEANQEKLVVISHGLWQRRFAGDPEIVGETLSLDEVPYEIVGVLRQDFLFPLAQADVWVPFTPNPAIPRRMRGVRMVARIPSEAGLEQAQSALDGLAERFRQEHPDLYPEEAGFGILAVPVREEILGDVRPLLLALQGAVALVLLIACANVANLLLAQSAARSREMALRTALGAGPGKLMRQLLVESLVLSLPAGALGLALAWVGAKILVAYGPGDVPRLQEVTVDLRVAGFALALTVITGVICGLVPALKACRPELVETLKEGGKTADTGSGRNWLRSGLVVAEIALAVTVLIGTGLTLRSLQHMMATDPGFRVDNLLTVQLELSGSKYRRSPERLGFYTSLLEELEALPGVQAVGLSSALPPAHRLVGGIPTVENRVVDSGTQDSVVRYGSINPDYFDALDISVLQGRAFDSRDGFEDLKVVIIDSALAERYWPGQSPLGRRLSLPGIEPDGTWRTVVGVVSQVRDQGLGTDITEHLYVPYSQLPLGAMGVALRTAGDPMAGVEALRSAVWEVDPAQPLAEVQPMEQRLASTLAQPRFNTFLFSLFGIVALLLAAIGVYGVMAYTVSQRRQEIGMRMALGALAKDVVSLITYRALGLAAAGIAVGLVLSWLLAQALDSFLEGLTYGVGTGDLLTFLAVPLVLAGLALLAAYLPARRATRIDPLVALRHE